jgi:hypothetical protein
LISSRHLRKWKIVLPFPDQTTWLHHISRTDVRGITPPHGWAGGNAASCVAGKVAFGVTQGGTAGADAGDNSFNSVVTLGAAADSALREISQLNHTDKLAGCHPIIAAIALPV